MAMGLSLGLIGAGGAILTIPIMIYLFKIPVIMSTTYSLIVVGTTALTAAFRYRDNIAFKKSLYFAIPSVTGVTLSRTLIVPRLPESFGFITRDQALILLLISLMLTASTVMIRNDTYNKEDKNDKLHLKVAGLALFLGLLLGILGAGGGFLIITILVVLLGFDMKEAIPTSLFITALNSLTGFFVDHHDFNSDHWLNIAGFLSAALIGMTIGIQLSRVVHSDHNQQNLIIL